MKVLWIGDSHSEPNAGRNLAYWVPRLWPEAQVEVVGQRGWSTRAWARSGGVEALAARVQPDVVVLALGGNDRVLTAAEWQVDAASLLAQVAAGAPDARVLWLGPSYATDGAVGMAHGRTAGQQRLVLRALDVPWVDSRPFTWDGHASDGIHFTRSGYESWAKGAVPALRRRASDAGSSVAAWALGSVVAGAAAFGLWWALR